MKALCTVGVALKTMVTTRCTHGILKSLISVQQSALHVEVSPAQAHTHTSARPFCSVLSYAWQKTICWQKCCSSAPHVPAAVPAHCSYITKHLCVRNALFILVAPGSFSQQSAPASCLRCRDSQSVWLPEQNIACYY